LAGPGFARKQSADAGPITGGDGRAEPVVKPVPKEYPVAKPVECFPERKRKDDVLPSDGRGAAPRKRIDLSAAAHHRRDDPLELPVPPGLEFPRAFGNAPRAVAVVECCRAGFGSAQSPAAPQFRALVLIGNLRAPFGPRAHRSDLAMLAGDEDER